jgi:hypothetical protein
VTARRFPPPWTVEDIGAAFVVIDSGGQQLAYIYYEDIMKKNRADVRQRSYSPKMRREGSLRTLPGCPSY